MGLPFARSWRYGLLCAKALLRHKNHVATSIGKAQAKREERLGDSLLADMQRLREKIWKMLSAAERDRDRVDRTEFLYQEQ